MPELLAKDAHKCRKFILTSQPNSNSISAKNLLHLKFIESVFDYADLFRFFSLL